MKKILYADTTKLMLKANTKYMIPPPSFPPFLTFAELSIACPFCFFPDFKSKKHISMILWLTVSPVLIVLHFDSTRITQTWQPLAVHIHTYACICGN